MANFKHLRDLYRFPGFVPSQRIRGVFGDPMAVVISLQRNRKKRFAASAARLTSATTINGTDRSGTSPPATDASICRSSFAGFFVRSAAA
jgi:hypothetical protein